MLLLTSQQSSPPSSFRSIRQESTMCSTNARLKFLRNAISSMQEECLLHQFLISPWTIGEEGNKNEMLSRSFGLQRKPTSTYSSGSLSTWHVSPDMCLEPHGFTWSMHLERIIIISQTASILSKPHFYLLFLVSNHSFH